MKINPELKTWFIQKNKEHILEIVSEFKNVEWFEKFNCPIKNRTVEEMMHLMAQFRDGAISYKMLFQEPKHPKQK